MGAVRVFLALSVVTWHIYGGDVSGTPFVTGYIAVLAFFMISGFYMSLVIDTKYESRVGAFYLSRILRLFPVYLVTLGATVALGLLAGLHTNLDVITGQANPLVAGLLVAANVGILGLDAYPYFHLGGIASALIPVAWTLSIELQFYLVAPFIVRRSLWLSVGLLAACLAIRFSLLGSEFNMWRYYFAPSVWCFFLMGHIAYRLALFIKSEPTRKLIGWFAIAAAPFAGAAAGVQEVKDLDRPELWLFYLFVAAAIPFVFAVSKRSAVDRFIGNLSYPIYLTHLLVIAVAGTFISQLLVALPAWGVPATLIFVVVVLSLALHLILEVPIDALRAAMVRRARRAPEP